MPGYERAQRMSREAGTAVRGGTIAATWIDGKAFEYTRDGKRLHFDVASRVAWEVPNVETSGRGNRGGDESPERGRQFESTASPDGKLKAFYRNRNVWLSRPDGSNEVAVTTDGSTANRVKYGTASWVYGEELSQRTAMWWSPDGAKLAFYRFDETPVPDYYVPLNQTRLQSTVDTEAYPKAGVPNPIVDVIVYDVATKRSTTIDVRDGKPVDNSVVGHYVYHVQWSADGRELLFFRTNRRQNVMEVAAADPATGRCRVVLREEWPTGWLNSEPRMLFLSDGRRFVWESQRNGWNNFYLYDLSRGLIRPITTSTTFEAAALVKVDEKAGVVFYTARDGDNLLKLQLHRVGLDGTGDRRLTDPAFHHTIGGCIPNLGSRPEQPAVFAPCSVAPDNGHFIDIYQTHDTPPATRVVDATSGAVVADVVKSDTTKFQALGLKKAETVHVHGRGRPHVAARAAAFPDHVRSGEALSAARLGLRRPGVFEQHRARNIRDAEFAYRVRIPVRDARLPRHCRSRQAHARQSVHEARSDRNGRHGGRYQVSMVARVCRQDSGRHLRHVVRRLHGADGAPAATPTSSPPRPRRRPSPTGRTTTRFAPSATCGFRRRTRRDTRKAARSPTPRT